MRVCCLRACSRWRAPVLDPAPMEKAGVDEPGSRKVAQVSAAPLGAGTGGSVIPTRGGMEGFASPGAQQVPPELAPRAQPGPSAIPSLRGQHDPSAPQGRSTNSFLTKGSADSPEARGRSAGRPEGKATASTPHRSRDRRALPEGGRRSSWKATHHYEPQSAKEEEPGLQEPAAPAGGTDIPLGAEAPQCPGTSLFTREALLMQEVVLSW